ncbi:MAG: transposase [Verrucomicrobiales bacterium]|nr:transposase [Verrucomicrobiales bacterium]
MPGAPTSHPFIERLIGTIRREFLDHFLFWYDTDLTRKLAAFVDYYNRDGAHAGVHGPAPAEAAGATAPIPADFRIYSWKSFCGGLFQLLLRDVIANSPFTTPNCRSIFSVV